MDANLKAMLKEFRFRKDNTKNAAIISKFENDCILEDVFHNGDCHGNGSSILFAVKVDRDSHMVILDQKLDVSMNRNSLWLFVVCSKMDFIMLLLCRILQSKSLWKSCQITNHGMWSCHTEWNMRMGESHIRSALFLLLHGTANQNFR